MRTIVPVARRWWALSLAGATCIASLILYRAELAQVPYLNDFAMHEEMVRSALAEIRSGHFPPDSWFPFLNLGSPFFLHYQSLGAMLTALLAWGIGVGRAFTVTTWLLVCCWPIAVYAAGRLFGLRRGAAAAAALASPFVSSATGVGYERITYLWTGFGLWAQLWAMWTLPFAWACSWRAVEERRLVLPAAVLVAATAAFHFETGYLAFLGIVVFVLVRPGRILVRLGRGLVVLVGAFALAAWAIVPLVAQGRWAAINQFLQNGADSQSYGARRVLSWLVDGGIFDWHHLFLVTPFVLAGLAVCLLSWRRPAGAGVGLAGVVGSAPGRALVVLFGLALLLFFGRPTLGPALDLLPGAKDLFLRRFVVGVQLAGLLLAGVGVEWLGVAAVAAVRRLVLVDAGRRAGGQTGEGAGEQTGQRVASLAGRAAAGVLVLGAVAALVPAWSFAVTQADADQAYVNRQIAARPEQRRLDALLALVAKDGGGRVFAGDPSDWGEDFTVGDVPVYAYLASKDVDEVGFSLRTASLMSDPEVEFDEGNPADYRLFGIRFLLLPSDMQPPVPAHLLEVRGRYGLWQVAPSGYVQVVDTRGHLSATSADLGAASAGLLTGLSAVHPVLPTVAYEGGAAAPGTLPPGTRPVGRPGRVLAEHDDLAGGQVSVTVSTRRPAVVLLSASYDPGWQAFVDGRRVATQMVAPALIGVRVGPGVHRVRFVYRGFPDYPLLFVIGGVALALLAIWARRDRRSRGSEVP